MSEALHHYAGDRTRVGDPVARAHAGAAGGAACGDLVGISFRLNGGRLVDVRISARGCAAARAAIAATAELADRATLVEAALIGAESIEAELGGLTPVGRHAAELASDALHRALGAAAISGQNLLEPPAGAERVLVAISGGVDSAVALHLERGRGAEVVAVTLELWADPANDGERSCCSPQAVRLARSVAQGMGVPHLTLDLRERFRDGVVEPFLDGYAAGITPNPCVTCNGRVRLEPMIDLAARLGATGLATGHYARIADDGHGPLLAAAADPAKDQGYMLAALAPDLLGSLRFPLGGLRKPEVRAIAAEAGIPVASRAESQDLCFLAGEGKAGFLARHGGLGERAGEIVDRTGRSLGRHRGHHNFTVGQRRGLALGAPEPLYVLATDAASNRVVVGSAAELENDRVPLRDGVLHRRAEAVDAIRLRYRSAALPCRLQTHREGWTVALRRPERRPAPGQTAVLYAGGLIVGHAVIGATAVD
jgi:tRNA-uridine 2-sulfurtransferase